MLGVKTMYKLIGKDHKNAISIKTFFFVSDAAIAKQAGKNNVRNVLINVSNPGWLE